MGMEIYKVEREFCLFHCKSLGCNGLWFVVFLVLDIYVPDIRFQNWNLEMSLKVKVE